MALYNLRTALDDFRITKFTDDLEVESSYIISTGIHGPIECECPAGTRSTCRHRQMLPNLLSILDTEYFWNYEKGFACTADNDLVEIIPTPADEPATEPAPEIMPSLPEGVTMLSLDDPVALHNAIAEAVGEPRDTTPAKSWRRI